MERKKLKARAYPVRVSVYTKFTILVCNSIILCSHNISARFSHPLWFVLCQAQLFSTGLDFKDQTAAAASAPTTNPQYFLWYLYLIFCYQRAPHEMIIMVVFRCRMDIMGCRWDLGAHYGSRDHQDHLKPELFRNHLEFNHGSQSAIIAGPS